MNFDMEGYKNTFQWDAPGDFVPYISLPDNVVKDVQNRIRYALEWRVYPRIKGCVTAGKLKWRGIKRKCALIYKEHCWEIYINDDGSITTTHVGTAVKEEGKNLDLIYPIISQREHLIDLNLKLGRGVLDQIAKIE